jgi:hypothetical protein
MLSVESNYCYAECHYADCHYAELNMPNVFNDECRGDIRVAVSLMKKKVL